MIYFDHLHKVCQTEKYLIIVIANYRKSVGREIYITVQSNKLEKYYNNTYAETLEETAKKMCDVLGLSPDTSGPVEEDDDDDFL